MTAPLLAPIQDLARCKRAWKGVSALTSSSLALILGTLITSALGMVFWALAARLLTPAELGIGAVLISSIMTLSHAAQLNLRNLLHRFVPTSGAGAGRIIHRSYAAAAGMALLLGTGFVILVPVTTPDLAFLAQAPLAAVGFIAALLIWTLYALQEAALTARRLARFVPLQGLAYSCAKIVCLFAAVTTISGGGAAVVAMILPALLIGLVTHMAMARQPVPDLLQGRAEVITRQQIFSFLRWDYVGALATSIALGVAPIVVTTISGAADLSAYYLAWSITYMLYLVARHVGSAMLSELGAHKSRRQAAYAEAIILTVVLTGLGVAALLLFAPLVMLIFGPDYVQQGSDLLRVLALSCIPGSVVTIYLAICRAEEKVRQIALLQVITLAGLLAIGIPLTYALGPMGMAIGWLAAYSVAAALMVALAVAGRDGVELRGFAIDLISASQQLLRQLSSLGRPVRAKPAARFEMAGQTWLLGDVGPASLSDASTLVIESADPTAASAFILKRATSANGRLALEREYACLLRIHGNDALHSAWGDLLPEALHFENVTEEATLLMSKLPGRDARTLAGSPDRLAPLLASAAGKLAAAPLGERRIQERDWLDRWIEAPLQRLAVHDQKLQHFQILVEQMRQHWSHTATRTGPAHGDFCLDNLMVEADENGELKVSGLVDWGGFQADAPAGFDLCTMAITLRAAASGRQLGQVVVELLNEPRWTEVELAWMSAGGKEPWMHDRTVLRATVLLAWLHHVDANLGKSARYSTGSFWGRVNIELVLRNLAPKPMPSAPRRQPALAAPRLERTDSPLIACLLLATGLLLWVASLPYIDPSSLGGFGLLTILPAGIYLAYAAIIAGFCLSLTGATLRTPLPFLFLVALVLLLHGTPAISYETLRYSWAWKHIGVIDYIMRHDSLDPTARYLSAYHNWPGFFLVSAWIAKGFNLDPLGISNLARFFPTALNIGFAIAVPLLLRNFTQDRRLVWAATALFLLGNWVGQDYFSPQGTTFLLYICLFPLLTGPLAAGRKSHHPILLAGFTLLALAIIGAIIATHQITPLFMLSALFCLALVGQVGFGYFLFALVAELLWLFYVADPFIAPELADLLAGFGKVGGETLGKLARTEIISAEQRIVSLASRGLSAVLGLLAILGVLLRLRTWKRDIVPLALMAAPMPVLFVTPYGGEVIFRLYLFATPLLAFFAASLFIPSQQDAKNAWRLPVLGIVLLLMVPAFVLANNGKDAQYWFSPEEVEAADFLYGNSKPGQLLIEGSRSYPSQFRNYENFAYVPLSEELPELADELLNAPDRLVVRWLRNNLEGGYVVITRSQKAMFDALGLLPQGALGEVERRLISSPDLDLVFANKDATILALRQP